MAKPRKLTAKQTESFRKDLEEIRREVLSGIQQRIAAKRDDTGVKEIGDDFDSASEGREQELGFLMNTRDREKIVKIEEALRRIDDGEYGICEECGEPIGAARLKAMPFTVLCVRCQEAEEEWTKIARERELEEDDRQFFEVAESELADKGNDVED